MPIQFFLEKKLHIVCMLLITLLFFISIDMGMGTPKYWPAREVG